MSTGFATDKKSAGLQATTKSLKIANGHLWEDLQYTLEVSGSIEKVPNNASKQGAGTVTGTVSDGRFDKVEYTGNITGFSASRVAPSKVTLTGAEASRITASGGSFSVAATGGSGGGGGGENGGGSDGSQPPATTGPLPASVASFLPPKIAGINSGYVILGAAGLAGLGLVGYTASQG